MSRFIWKKNQTRRIHTTIRHDHLFELSSHKKLKWGVFVLGSKKKVFLCCMKVGNTVWWKEGGEDDERWIDYIQRKKKKTRNFML